MLSHLGLTESYSNLIAKTAAILKPAPTNPDAPNPAASKTAKKRTKKKKKKTPEAVPALAEPAVEGVNSADKKKQERKPGTLKRLSDAMRGAYRVLAETGLYGTVYDNINFMDRNAEQIIGRTSTYSFFFEGERKLSMTHRHTGEWDLCYHLAAT